MTSDEAGRLAVVTGGTGALGRWVVRELADAGHRVRVPVRSGGAGEEIRAFLGAELDPGAAERVAFRRANLTVPDEVEAFFADVEEEEGGADVLVSTVGAFAMAPVEKTDPATWERMMELNATTAFLCARAAVPGMKRRGWGRIVTVASFPALERAGGPGMSAYAAGKAALVGLTRSLASELREHGITANAVVPRVIDTPANREAMPDADRSGWLDPAEIARVVAFLVGDDGAVVTGAEIPLER